MSANDRQVGGSHYKQEDNTPQHWDLVVMYGWDYFQSQVTKYLMRWKTKHKDPEKQLEDLKKSAHFLQKYIEEAEAGATFPTNGGLLPLEPAPSHAIDALAREMSKKDEVWLTPYGMEVVDKAVRAALADMASRATGWRGFTYEADKEGFTIYTCQRCKEKVSTTAGEAPYIVHQCGAEPGRAYVNQG